MQKHLRLWIECKRPAQWPLGQKQKQLIVSMLQNKPKQKIPNCPTQAKRTNIIGHEDQP